MFLLAFACEYGVLEYGSLTKKRCGDVCHLDQNDICHSNRNIVCGATGSAFGSSCLHLLWIIWSISLLQELGSGACNGWLWWLWRGCNILEYIWFRWLWVHDIGVVVVMTFLAAWATTGDVLAAVDVIFLLLWVTLLVPRCIWSHHHCVQVDGNPTVVPLRGEGVAGPSLFLSLLSSSMWSLVRRLD